MYTSVIGLGILYVFISWMFVTGWGLTRAPPTPSPPSTTATSRRRSTR